MKNTSKTGRKIMILKKFLWVTEEYFKISRLVQTPTPKREKLVSGFEMVGLSRKQGKARIRRT